MLVKLTFTNAGRTRASEGHTIYLAIDDEAGRNYLRRVLPHVDLSTIAPGERLTFSDRLLAPTLPVGHYKIHLWIPSRDPSLKFDPAHNLLLSSVGVANPATGLNTLAALIVDGPGPARH